MRTIDNAFEDNNAKPRKQVLSVPHRHQTLLGQPRYSPSSAVGYSHD